jgi:hypothetical protein
MSKRPEQKFKLNIKKAYERIKLKVNNFESEGTEVGIPDQYICGLGIQAWIEYKVEYSSDWPCKRQIIFRPRQYSWLKDEYEHGGLAFVCIQYMNGCTLVAIQDVDHYTRRPSIEKSFFMDKVFDAQAAIDWMRVKRLEAPR